MKAHTLKTFLDVHTWTGLGAGMALFIAFYAGAMTVFHHELQLWESYDPTPSEVFGTTHEEAQTLIDLVVAAEPRAAESLRLYPSSEDHPGHEARWFERLEDGTFEGHEYRLGADGTLKTGHEGAHLADFVYRLHYTAGLPSSFGIYVLGIVSMIYGLAIVTGLLIFLPNFLKDLFIVRPGRNNKRFWRDAHNVVGVVSLPWHVMFAWSSVLLTIGIFFIAPFQFVVYEDDLIEMLGPQLGVIQPLEPKGEPGNALSVGELMAIVEREAPGIEATQMRFANYGDANAMVSVFGAVDAGTLVDNASVSLAVGTGETLAVSHPADAGLGTAFYNGLIALHFAAFGGYVSKWVYFLLGLGGAFLFFSGNLLWVETRRKRRQAEQPGKTVFLARLNSGVCIGCMAGISAAFLSNRALAGMESHGELTELTYYVVFLVSLAWCFLRSVAAGARDLLYLCALLTLAIPLFDALYVDRPIWTSFAHGEWALVFVDLIAFLGAAVFLMLGRAVQARAATGDPNSVWAHAPGKSLALPESAT